MSLFIYYFYHCQLSTSFIPDQFFIASLFVSLFPMAILAPPSLGESVGVAVVHGGFFFLGVSVVVLFSVFSAKFVSIIFFAL